MAFFTLVLNKKTDAKKDNKDKHRAPPLAFGMITSTRRPTTKKVTVTKKDSTTSADSGKQ
ncbi:hypothetical protein PRIPAC_76799 [Pristionchus pacificus]|uniref:Uncharacterized protein n=1 Tax=Pristionchus pacificus TaxID=54126 RepID=A0A454XX33_PRIPA|nr:hypothetical protein PRIPAC_76799 [Pristionchus pacificus]|eukprot:PDM72912.1 hypothetical protein PRIPAC_39346 [Pristionchus pacificus]